MGKWVLFPCWKIWGSVCGEPMISAVFRPLMTQSLTFVCYSATPVDSFGSWIRILSEMCRTFRVDSCGGRAAGKSGEHVCGGSSISSVSLSPPSK
ncbi:hypothetical protein BX600DRAFT_461245 [Xylariales sp. PMI_506]|nr:hypothetical protein BX600DRAFT_461245 [Xylariales sp. PMI_506]